MKKKIMIILISMLCIAAIVAGILYGVVVPKVIIPKIQKYVDANMSGQIKMAIGNISFNPFSGFALKEVELKGPVVLKDNNILYIDSADIDLALLPLFRKRIEVTRFEMDGVNLNIGRDINGVWNFQPLIESGILGERDTGKYRFLINEFIIRKGKLNFFDYSKKQNTLERKFENVDLFLQRQGGESYRFYVSGNAFRKSDESIDLKLDFNTVEKYASGFVKLNTRHLSEYWQYYLDDMLKPWNLKAENVAASMNFSYIKDTLLLNGRYGVSNGIISYGDLSIRGNADVKQKIKFIKGIPTKDFARVDLSLDDISSSTGEYVFLDRGKCTAFITEKEVAINELVGMVKGQPINFNGNFTFGETKELCLKGKAANIDNNFNLKLLSENQGVLNWTTNIGNSNVNLYADISDLRNMVMNSNIKGIIELTDLSELLKIDREKIHGKVDVSGNVKGEMDELSTLQGGVNIGVKGFSLWDLEPIDLIFDMNFTKGILQGQIPKIDYYKGMLYGNVMMDYNRWGLELNLEKFDIEEFVKTRPKFKGMRGILTGEIACICDWGIIESLKGGGYIKLVKCDLWNAPIFSDTEKGIESITTEVEMPVVKSVEGNYRIENKDIFIENAFCDAQSMDLNMTGKISFSGMVDITVGAQLMGKGLFRIAKHILVPVTIGIDMVADCIQVRITGKWPNLEHSSQIQPMRWLTGLFSGLGGADPQKYNLEELWKEQNSNSKLLHSHHFGVH